MCFPQLINMECNVDNMTSRSIIPSREKTVSSGRRDDTTRGEVEPAADMPRGSASTLSGAPFLTDWSVATRNGLGPKPERFQCPILMRN
jgi:hypothetical protein